MFLRAIKHAVKKVCPDFILQILHGIHLREINKNNRRWVSSLLQGGGGYKIEYIEIETINRCNGTCPFCPVNVNQPQRPYTKMTEELFRKIIEELAEMNYTGNIALYSNNEPFLDERIIDFYRYANEKLPHAVFHLYTNGSLLTFEKFIEIMPYLDKLVIDNYNDKKEINSPELQKIYDYLQERHELTERVQFSFRLQNEILTSRGGQAPNKQGKNDTGVISVFCTSPFRTLIIRPSGEISLCCNDPLGKCTMGDLRTHSIQEVWTSKKYEALRQEMLANGRKNLMPCRNCDAITGTTSFVRRRP